MWILSSHSSFFAGIFYKLPNLWAHWYFKAVTPSHQDPHTIFAVNIWRHFQTDVNLDLPLSVHLCSGIFSIAHIHQCLPVRRLAAIRELHVGLSESTFHRRLDIHKLFLAMVSLKKLHLTVFNSVFNQEQGSIWVANSPLRDDDLPALPRLTSLHLDGVVPDSDCLTALPMSNLAVLELSNVARNPLWRSASLDEILESSTSLASLAVRADGGQRLPDTFWRLDELRLTALALRIQSLELRGSVEDLDPFVAALLTKPTPRLVSVDVVFHLWPREPAKVDLGVLDSLTRIVKGRLSVVSFHGSSLSVELEGVSCSGGPIVFRFVWKSMSDLGRRWVSASYHRASHCCL